MQDRWDGKEPLTIHVFKSRAGRYEFEKTVDFGPSSPEGQLNGVIEFFLSLPLHQLNFRLMQFPFSDKEKLKSVIPFELDNLILGGAENAVFDSVVLGKTNNASDLLVAYGDRKTLRDVLTRLASLGIDPQTVTSLELGAAISKGANNLGPYLMEPEGMSSEQRIELAKKELAAPTINLRTGPFAYTMDVEKTRKRLKVTATLLLLLALVINSDLVLRLIVAKKGAASMKNEMRSIYTGLFPNDKKIGDEFYQLKSHMKELGEREALLTGVSPLPFLTELSRRTLPGVRFDEISLDKDVVTIKGEANSMDDADRIKSKLSDFLRGVIVSDIKTAVDGKIRFTVVAKGYRQS